MCRLLYNFSLCPSKIHPQVCIRLASVCISREYVEPMQDTCLVLVAVTLTRPWIRPATLSGVFVCFLAPDTKLLSCRKGPRGICLGLCQANEFKTTQMTVFYGRRTRLSVGSLVPVSGVLK